MSTSLAESATNASVSGISESCVLVSSLSPKLPIQIATFRRHNLLPPSFCIADRDNLACRSEADAIGPQITIGE